MIFNKEKETDSVIIFLHIPKTGGTTLNSIIDKQYNDYCYNNGIFDYGWKIYKYEKKNVTKDRLTVKEISNEIIKIIKRKNQKDIKLYKFANTLLDEQLQQFLK